MKQGADRKTPSHNEDLGQTVQLLRYSEVYSEV